jgi:hypothetical protein
VLQQAIVAIRHTHVGFQVEFDLLRYGHVPTEARHLESRAAYLDDKKNLGVLPYREARMSATQRGEATNSKINLVPEVRRVSSTEMRRPKC